MTEVLLEKEIQHIHLSPRSQQLFKNLVSPEEIFVVAASFVYFEQINIIQNNLAKSSIYSIWNHTMIQKYQ